MSRQLSENAIVQILEDCSDSESDEKQEISEDEANISDQETVYSEHDSSSEIEQSDDSSASQSEEETIRNCFYSKTRYKWSKTPPHPSRIRQHNIIEECAGLKGPALSKNEMSPVETWELLLTDDIIQAIVLYTNQKLEAQYIPPLVRPYYAKNIDSCLTYVGTLQKNKREIPREFLPNTTRPVESSLFGFVSDKTLVSHVPKKNKSVVLLSSMHHDMSVNEQSKKPEIIELYNSTKGGVDALDLKCSNYSCARRTRRWPNAMFGAIMNISIANGYVLWVLSNPNKKLSRRNYIKSIAMTLIKPHVSQRWENNPTLTKDIKAIMCKLIDKEQPLVDSDEAGHSAPKMKRRCFICPRAKDKKSTIVCKSCK
ncbi:unnamed protein product [Parnassius mnemosyne]|uniref:PiggyBac transposable element-derived protein domain-containing protein n=1 Tax=Parnassius mnemosyne TaxID=213953 RepID=A0AAV1LTX3_9NEOP